MEMNPKPMLISHPLLPIPSRKTLISIPAAILYMIDGQYSVELAVGDLRILRLRQGSNTIAALAAVSDDVQWPLTKDLAAVKLDSSHYFFTFKPPRLTEDSDSNDDEEKKNLNKSNDPGSEMLSYGFTVVSKGKKGLLKELGVILETCWTILAPNVEENSGTAARLIAAGSGQLIKGVLWCADVTVARLKKGNEIMINRMAPGGKAERS